jgi:hypothetical protein
MDEETQPEETVPETVPEVREVVPAEAPEATIEYKVSDDAHAMLKALIDQENGLIAQLTSIRQQKQMFGNVLLKKHHDGELPPGGELNLDIDEGKIIITDKTSKKEGDNHG